MSKESATAQASEREMANASPAAKAATERLIRMASAGAQDATSEIALSGEKERTPMWKILLQLKAVLPYLARLSPLLEIALGPSQQAAAAIGAEIKQHVVDIRSDQRDLRTTVEAQTLEIKRLQEQMVRLVATQELNASKQREMLEETARIHNLVRIVGGTLGLLLLVAIGMLAMVIAHTGH